MENEINKDNQPASIWDLWTDQVARARASNAGNCALGWADRRCYKLRHGIDNVFSAYMSGYYAEDWDIEVRDVYERVAKYIREHYKVPASLRDHDTATIAYANNELNLTPDDFRRIDRLTQIESAVKPLVESVSEVGTETVR